MPHADGTDLVPYTGPDKDTLTVGGELDKLASNIGIGRNISGGHWRSSTSGCLRAAGFRVVRMRLAINLDG